MQLVKGHLMLELVTPLGFLLATERWDLYRSVCTSEKETSRNILFGDFWDRKLYHPSAVDNAVYQFGV